MPGRAEPGRTGTTEGFLAMNRNALHLAALVMAVGLISFASLAFAQHGNAQGSSASSTAGFGLKGIGARLGYVDPEDASGTLAYGFHVDLGQPVRNVNLVPFLEYWKAGALGVDRSDLTLATNVNVDFPLQGGTFVPYLGGGLGWHHIKSDATSGFTGNNLGLHVLGGVKDQVMPNLGLFGELRFSLVDNTDQFKLMGGMTYYFIY